MLAIPEPTSFDLNFRLLGIPVRINPFFWAAAAFLGWQSHDGFELLTWIACVFVSILVHEYGHGLTIMALSSQRPRIVFHYLGGLCVPEREQRSPWRQVLVSLMGPGAGFLLFGVVAVAGTVVLGITPFRGRMVHLPPSWYTPSVAQIYEDLIFINLYWGLFNLMPIYPLDGGQVTGVLLTMRDRRRGAAWGHIVSMAAAGLLALYVYQQGATTTALFLAYLGLINFQLYQAAKYQGTFGGSAEEDDDWWRR